MPLGWFETGLTMIVDASFVFCGFVHIPITLDTVMLKAQLALRPIIAARIDAACVAVSAHAASPNSGGGVPWLSKTCPSNTEN